MKMSILNNYSTMDFYQNPPKTIPEIAAYLTSWLQPVDSSTTVSFNGVPWTQTHGFTRAFHIHAVFQNEAQQYCFHVQDKNETDSSVFVPNMGVYDDWDSMIIGVATIYNKLWYP